ncbi:glutathione S-transferase [Polymorphobacter multimanifer]|uniref:Putative MAPEG superfamily protein n=1 Tax=Polymorphobacter multimanifer TaxID=1070431 RepID=A0A841LI88_9SPHN|nr:MAPEG family protein [Polymorphobacter multimanifer]MBB6228688.1 putative MAPEG superfamily protein [Polymorphobacter multimanifer]GGI88881.1 glutathione S-transferase [Polymorphobacter multimanifer]
MTAFPLTTLAIVVALFVFFGLAINVGRARATWNVPAPMSTGHPEFDKRFRVQMNTLEQLIMFLPAIILAAPVLGDLITALLGFTWSLGRILYAKLYYADPAKRGPGFGLSFFPTLFLLIAAAWGAVTVLIA